MQTLTIVASKGGSGKTTLAVNLAMAAFRRGRSVVIADVDPQRSTSAVLKLRTDPGPQLFEGGVGKLFQLQQAGQRSGLGLFVIDTPCHSEGDVAEAIKISDLCVVVSRPTFLDLASAVRTAQLVRRLGRPGIAVLNQAPVARMGVEPALVAKALEALRFTGLPVAKTSLRARTAFAASLGQGKGAEEWNGNGGPAAAAEVASLWDEVAALLSAGRAPAPAPSLLQA